MIGLGHSRSWRGKDDRCIFNRCCCACWLYYSSLCCRWPFVPSHSHALRDCVSLNAMFGCAYRTDQLLCAKADSFRFAVHCCLKLKFHLFRFVVDLLYNKSTTIYNKPQQIEQFEFMSFMQQLVTRYLLLIAFVDHCNEAHYCRPVWLYFYHACVSRNNWKTTHQKLM